MKLDIFTETEISSLCCAKAGVKPCPEPVELTSHRHRLFP